MNSWSGNEGFEYWFPRPVQASHAGEKPLVILGGGREVQEGKNMFEIGEADDSVISQKVGAVLRKFLPAVFPGLYEEAEEPEREWVRIHLPFRISLTNKAISYGQTGIMGFTVLRDPFVSLSYMLCYALIPLADFLRRCDVGRTGTLLYWR